MRETSFPDGFSVFREKSISIPLNVWQAFFVFCNPEYLAHPASGRWGMDGNDKNVGFTGNTWRNVNGRTIKEAARFYP